jgi:thiamine pyrophosphate-dependent acetolactate synthase large subunit-like protein
MNKDYPKESVIDIAMSVLSDMATNPSASRMVESNRSAPKVKDYVPDIRVVDEVPEDFISLIIDGKAPAKNKKTVAIQEQKAEEVEPNYENKVQSLISRLSDLLKEAKEVLTEMTGSPTMVGHLGINMAGPQKDPLKKKKKKNGYPNLNSGSKNRAR